MRRKDRDMGEEFARQLLDRCTYATIAMTDADATPYCLPITIVRQQDAIYFHSAKAGRKYAILQGGAQLCLSCVGNTSVPAGQFTTLFESAVAFGPVHEVTEDAEKIKALRLLCQRHTPDNMAAFDRAIAKSLPVTAVFRMDIQTLSGKAKR